MRRTLTSAVAVLVAGPALPAGSAIAQQPATGTIITAPAPVAAPGTGQVGGVPTLPPKRGFMVPQAVTLRTLTPAETAAHAVWTLRAALNVAALQCQFSPFLDTVKIYNAMLKHHSDELARAQRTMQAHFRRYDGPAKAINNFDQYTTRTYNSFSTLDAQYAFCGEAALVGRKVMATPRGSLGAEAMLRNPEIRSALAERPFSPALVLVDLAPLELPLFTPT